MNYTQFLTSVEAHMQTYFDESYSLSIQSILKNNNTTQDGLVIFKPGSNISPTIYLNPYYHRFLDGIDMDDICDDIYCTYVSHCPDHNISTEAFSDFSKVKGKIVMKLINYERNKTLLETVPYIRFLDLAVVFQIYLTNMAFGNGTILIHNTHMELWDTTPDLLFSAARINTPKILEVFCEPIVDCIKSLASPLELPDEEIFECSMKVLSNSEKTYGAAAMLYDGVLQELAAEAKRDLLILPSSIHEVILLPVEKGMDTETFSEMIKEINDTQVQDDEVLSDHPYYYSRLTDRITAIA